MKLFNKPELLAPAGDYDSLIGAINAGADAIYLAGMKFGARAYATNFDEEALAGAIRLCHIHNKKIYITLNTLVKESEFSDLYDYLTFLDSVHPDALIVQDLGVANFIHSNFPSLELHASTQMTITGIEGANGIKNLGFTRVVPARELSLNEIEQIKESGLEVEIFIHGAMCYSYSGQCLFSSIVGGRSGNRGRCAQPCRLPYRINHEELYPLSMKDLCLADKLSDLMKIGVDSFKIEGRMKSAEYVAGTTALYRQLIDRYYDDPKAYYVSKEEKNRLRSLYIRGDISEGFLYKYNGKELITIQSSSYNSEDKQYIQDIHDKYLTHIPHISIRGSLILNKGKNAIFKVSTDSTTIEVQGETVLEALTKPLRKEDVEKKLRQTGDTPFSFSTIQMEIDDDAFLPIGSIKELRRKAIDLLTNDLLESFSNKKINYETNKDKNTAELEIKNSGLTRFADSLAQFEAVVSSWEQFGVVKNASFHRIYFEYYMFHGNNIHEIKRMTEGTKSEIWISTPYINRLKNKEILDSIFDFIEQGIITGVLCRNLEALFFFSKRLHKDKIALDTGLYVWNNQSMEWYSKHSSLLTLPLELNKKELFRLQDKHLCHTTQMVYGRIPMMISVNCVAKTMNKCRGTSCFTTIEDRYSNAFPVLSDCISCYNVLYNSVPLSLHDYSEEIRNHVDYVRLNFSTEDALQTKDIIDCFVNGTGADFPMNSYTKGHYKRGVL